MHDNPVNPDDCLRSLAAEALLWAPHRPLFPDSLGLMAVANASVMLGLLPQQRACCARWPATASRSWWCRTAGPSSPATHVRRGPADAARHGRAGAVRPECAVRAQIAATWTHSPPLPRCSWRFASGCCSCVHRCSATFLIRSREAAGECLRSQAFECLCKPSGPDGKGQARGQTPSARAEPPQRTWHLPEGWGRAR
jgi:hypothetical protein